MKKIRKHARALLGALPLILLGVGIGSAQAQGNYPDKPIKVIVPYNAGGGTDLFARVVSLEMGKQLGTPVVIENKPGAAGMLGGAAVAQAPADGYTLLVDQSSIATNPQLYAKVPFDVTKDLAPVILGVTLENVLLGSPQLPASNIKDVIALGKAKPGTLNYASTGIGSPQHLSMEMLRDQAGLQMVHVPYKGGNPGILATSMDEVQLFFISTSTALPFIKAGKVKAIGSGGLTRSPQMPDVPTLHESGLPNFQAVGWLAYFAPAGTPAPIVKKLNEALQKSLANPEVVKTLRAQGFEPAGGAPAELTAVVKRDMEHYGQIIRKVGIKAD
ncbi:tripartite tricarboxylate transporter substrate binding protein [Variovorax sp. KK3]|uniref:Bug family tripartite tricarboxylate transporter substrate binding protein n=1 Tax=Variovorax sp. KK3 TaxID=1855728 RepID=UPI00097C94FB|nr:tripartite tricarboxylate transporter substrate binding protein [Variovorax sp. KK3]